MQNPFLVLKENKYNNDNTTPVVESDNSINKLESLGFTYDEKTETYTKIDEDGEIKYKTSTNIIKITHSYESNLYETTLTIANQRISCTIFDNNGNVVMNVKYIIGSKNKECLLGNCKNYSNEINHILSIYNEIVNVLQ